MRRFAAFTLASLFAMPALSAVIFVDNSRAGGQGTYDKPFATLAQAQAVAREGDIIYVGQGSVPYEGGISLQQGQMLIGAAYGLGAAAVDFHLQIAQSVPAVQGPGPTIHGTVWLGKDNVVAGCTVTVETGTAINSSTPDSTVTLRQVFVRPAKNAIGISLQAPGAVSIQGGGMDGATIGTGLMIAGGTANVTIEGFPISGSFGTAIGIMSRQRGSVIFRNKSPVKVDTSGDAIMLFDSAALVDFEDPVQITTHGGRGVFVNRSNLKLAGGHSSIEVTGGAAVEVHDSALAVTLNAVSSSAADSGIILDKVRGSFAVTGDEKNGSGGTIRGAHSYGIRAMQSSGIHLAHMSIEDSGSANAGCLEASTNVGCDAAMYLGHVSASGFDGIAIHGGSGVGLNANNIGDVNFSALQISGTGRPAVLLQEAPGKVTFTLCHIAGESVFDQRFNSGRLSFDRCEFGPSIAPRPLFSAGLHGNASLDVSMTGSTLQGTSGSAMSMSASDFSSLCIDLTGNQILAGGVAPAVVVDRSAHSNVRVVGTAGPADVAISRANGSARVALNGQGAVSMVSSCP